MEFWGKQVNVTEAAARQQVAIINSFSSEKRFKIAVNFIEMGIQRTRRWIKERNPHFSENEITLEFVKVMYYETGKMDKAKWEFYQKVMHEKIRKDWAERFRKMMKENAWDYDTVAKLGGIKNAKVVKSTISRGLPSFAKLSIVVYEKMRDSIL